MNKNEVIKDYYRYYLLAEAEYKQTIPYVDLDENNFSTSSIKFQRELGYICSLIEAAFKAICSFHDPNFDPQSRNNNIKTYKCILLNKFPEITTLEVVTKDLYSIELSPFKNWDETNSKTEVNEENEKDGKKGVLQWWVDHNDVKHNQAANSHKGNLKNVLDALAALYILNLYLLKLICDRDNEKNDLPPKESELFILKGWETRAHSMTNMFYFEI